MLLVLTLSLFFQIQTDTVHVIVSDNDNVMGKIEENILKNIFRLHNKSSSSKLIYKLVKYPTYGASMNVFKTKSYKNKHRIFTINQVTITKEREKFYDFSTPYAPVKEVILAQKKVPFKPNASTRIGFLKFAVHAVSIKKLRKIKSFTPVPFETNKHMEQALIDKKVDFIYSENVSVWNSKVFRIVYTPAYQNGTGYGIMYPKGSSLKDVLDKYLIYYMKSAKFKQLVTRLYDKSVSEYFAKQLFIK